ncbi:trypsin-like peptidase domain-containing protein [Candidatus Margulisiibacteriota bacterium]
MKKILCLLFVLLLISSSLAEVAIPAAVNKVAESSVVLLVKKPGQKYQIFGNGFVVGRGRKVITGFHIIEGFTEADVITSDNTHYKVHKLHCNDQTGDIACLLTNLPRKIIPLKISAELPKKGDEIYLVEKAHSLQPYIKRGIVLFVGKVPDFGGEVIQISNPISPGASGSPVVNKNGEVVGAVSFRLIRGRGDNIQNFAVSSTRIQRLVDRRDNIFKLFWQWLREDLPGN